MSTHRRHVNLLLFVTLSLFIPPSFAARSFADQPIVNGKIERLGPFRVVRVWGTPKEMGFAHGYLLGKDIITEMNADYAQLGEEDRRARDEGMQSLRPTVRVPARIMEEIQGIFEGLVAAHDGRAPEVAALKRPFTLDDLILSNAGDMLRAFGCSGFTVWGDRAGDLGVITTRNFDYHLFTPTTLDTQFILVRQPIDGKQVALITWPGFIGAVTAINEHGVCAFMHDGTGPHINNPDGKFTPVAMAMTELLERVTPADAHAKFETGLKAVTPYPFSYLLRVVSPRVPGKVDVPERVFRIDAEGLGENPAGPSSCITTNHYIAKDGKPVPEADKWTLHRYKKLEENSTGSVTPEQAWKALESAGGEEGRAGTLYSLVLFPEKRKLELAFASLVNGNVKAAPKNEKVKISFDELFAAPPPESSKHACLQSIAEHSCQILAQSRGLMNGVWPKFESLPSFDTTVTELDAWAVALREAVKVKPEASPGSLHLQIGRCAHGGRTTRFVTIANGFCSDTHYFDATTGEFLAFHTTSDVIDIDLAGERLGPQIAEYSACEVERTIWGKQPEQKRIETIPSK